MPACISCGGYPLLPARESRKIQPRSRTGIGPRDGRHSISIPGSALDSPTTWSTCLSISIYISPAKWTEFIHQRGVSNQLVCRLTLGLGTGKTKTYVCSCSLVALPCRAAEFPDVKTSAYISHLQSVALSFRAEVRRYSMDAIREPLVFREALVLSLAVGPD